MIPTVDLAAWRRGDATVGATVDDALQRGGRRVLPPQPDALHEQHVSLAP